MTTQNRVLGSGCWFSVLTGEVREPPAKHSSVCTGADDVLVVGADLHAGDAATVPDAHMAHRTVRVVPHLHQLVIAT